MEHIIDTHFHLLHMHKQGIDVEAFLSEELADKLAFGIDIAVDEQNFEKRIELAACCPNIYHSVGLSPSCAEYSEKQMENALAAVERQASKQKVIAIGEMGMDFHWNYSTPEKQKQLFKRQIEIANRVNVPVIIHNRKADKDVLQVLQETPPQNGGIMHCYSSSAELVNQFVQLGMYISFAGNVTFKNAEYLRQAAQMVPSGRILVETDSPFLSPEPERGKTNTPLKIEHIYNVIAKVRNINTKTLFDTVSNNINILFNF